MSLLIPQHLPSRLTDPVVALLARTGVTPNILSVFGCLGSFLAGALLAQGWFLAGGVALLAFALLDGFDGALARATGRATAFGSVLDATLDRLSEAAVLFGLLVHYSSRNNQLLVLVIFFALVGSFLVSYVRARVEITGARLREGFFTRGVRVSFLAGALILSGLLSPEIAVAALWVLAIMANFTALHRLYVAWQRLVNHKEH